MTSTQDDLQHKSHEAFAQRYFHVVDDLMDPEQFAKLFNTDATFVLGNFPVAHGHEQIAAASNGVFSIVSALKHRVTRMYSIAPGTLQLVFLFITCFIATIDGFIYCN